MENLNIVDGLYELHETVKFPDRDIETKSFVKILDYKVDKDFLEEVTLGYVMELYKYAQGEESIVVERVLIPPFSEGLKRIMNVQRTREGKSPLQITTKP